MTFFTLWLISGLMTSLLFIGQCVAENGGLSRDDMVLAASLIVLGPITLLLMWIDRSA